MANDGAQIYCICRSTDISRFMIGCDECDEWYHGDCIDINAVEASTIKKFFCDACRVKNPRLKIKYKKKYREQHQLSGPLDIATVSKCDSDRSRIDSDQLPPSSTITDESRNKANKSKTIVIKGIKSKLAESKPDNLSESRKMGSDEKRDMKRIGDQQQDHLKKPKVRRNEERPDSAAKLFDEVISEDKKSVTMQNIPKLQLKNRLHNDDISLNAVHSSESTKNITTSDSHSWLSNPKIASAKPSPPSLHVDAAVDKTDLSSPVQQKSPSRKCPSVFLDDERNCSQTEPFKKSIIENHHRKKAEVTPGTKVIQCYGPGCVSLARKDSKYCSDSCGINLARKRLVTILPEKVQEWRENPPVADAHDREELEKLDLRDRAARDKLRKLDSERQQLEADIRHSQTLSPQYQESNDEDSSSENSVFCPVCGSLVSYAQALRHIERCFAKTESMTSYGSPFPTKIPGLFCDSYNARQNTYCKRLKVLCPEHTKDPKISDDQVCGCPMPKPGEILESANDKLYCLTLKRKCTKHHKWENLRRASIDIERVNQLMKLDEVYEARQNIEHSMSQRGGVLNLLLNTVVSY